jgi:DNA primase catalytic core
MNTKEFSDNLLKRSESFAEILSACQTLLKHSESAKPIRTYLNSRCPTFYQNKFNFGYFPHSSNLFELTEILGGNDKLLELELIYDKISFADGTPTKDPTVFFKNHNLIFPYKNLYGDIIAIVGRSLLEPDQQKVKQIPKYKNTIFTKNNHLFGLYQSKNDIIKKNSVILLEGQFDYISCYKKGIKNAVAVGCANLSRMQFYILKRYTNNFYFLFDNDKAGQVGYDKAVKLYGEQVNIQKIELPKVYKDVDEYLNNEESFDIFPDF